MAKSCGISHQIILPIMDQSPQWSKWACIQGCATSKSKRFGLVIVMWTKGLSLYLPLCPGQFYLWLCLIQGWLEAWLRVHIFMFLFILHQIKRCSIWFYLNSLRLTIKLQDKPGKFQTEWCVFQAKTGMGYNRTYGDIGAHLHSHTGNKEAYGAVLLPSTDPLLQQWLNTEKVPFVGQLLLFPTKQVSNEWPARVSKWSCAILPTQQCRKARENRQEIGSRFMERVG